MKKLSLLLLFVFFTLSGSRRNYYVLPVVPFAILMMGEWFLAGADQLGQRLVWAGRLAVTFFLLMFLSFLLPWAAPFFSAFRQSLLK